jgi:hypothetical protein
MANYKTQWKQFITDIGNRFKKYSPTYLTVMNEFSVIYNDAAQTTFVQECIQLAQSLGYKSGITTAGIEESFLLFDGILSVADVMLANCYPFITGKKNAVTMQDGVMGWQSQTILRYIKGIKYKYPNLKFIISESGMQDYYVALTQPSNFSWDSADMVETGGQAQSIYLIGLLEYLNNDVISEIWWWYGFKDNQATKSLLGNYLGGISYEYSK